MPSVIFDLLLVMLFFITYKMYDIYVATGVIIVGALLQVMGTRWIRGRFDKKQLLILAIVALFGGMTLYFHNPIFIKWKPTIVFWLLGIAFFLSQFFGKKPLVQRIMGHALEDKSSIPAVLWKRLNLAWTIFFILLGSINVLVAYYLSTDAWVNFKLYGVFGALLLFGLAQSVYLARYITVEK
jgi:intracellular septation protein